MTPMDKHIAQEIRMQKLRWATPIGLVILSCIVTAGFGFVGWCGDTAVKSLSSHFDSIEQKQDLLFKALSNMREKENSDVLCLTKNLYQCCGEKASASC